MVLLRVGVCVCFCVFLCGSRSFVCLFFCRMWCCVVQLNDVVFCFVCLSVRSGIPWSRVFGERCVTCYWGFPGMSVVDVVVVCVRSRLYMLIFERAITVILQVTVLKFLGTSCTLGTLVLVIFTQILV